MRLISLFLLCVLTSGCVYNERYGHRSYDVCYRCGEDWQFYPYAPGDAMRIAEEGRRCWSEENRANWDQCE